MSSKERAIQLLDRIPESKMYYVLSFLEDATIPSEAPSDETLAAMQELENGGGEVFSGSTEDFLSMLLED